MKQVIGIILIVVALFLAYLGITGLQESTAAVSFFGLEIRAEDSGAKEVAIIQLIGAAIALVGGIFLVGAKKK